MSTPITPTPPPPGIGDPTPRCPNCGAALARDQRYCLNCGQRLTEPRVDFHQALGLQPSTPPPPPRKTSWTDRGAVLTLVAIAAIVVALGVGIVIGRGKGGSNTAGRPTVVTVAGGGAAAPTNTPAASTGTETAAVKDDWPSGKSGWTVEVSSLPKSGTTLADVTAAKSAASAKGATSVGVLDGDQHSGTPTGKYVIYSGDFTSKKDAQAAQAKLKKKFPGALVLHVQPSGSGGGGSSATNNNAPSSGSAGLSQVQAEQHLSGRAYEKASAKLPSEVGTGGKPPPVDHKKAGGGTSATCIGC
jgi:hypothetical protein